MNIPYYKLLLFVLLIVGSMFAYNDEPKLKKHHWKLFWIEKEVKSIVKIYFIDETNIFDSLMIISYGYQLPIPGLVSAYINFTDFHKTQYHLSDIEKVSINNKLHSGKKLRLYRSALTSVPYFLLSGIIYSIYY